ncbi:MAG: hypothetical protein BJ554DRAFT_273, partial [Olpidium bornovanus]
MALSRWLDAIAGTRGRMTGRSGHRERTLKYPGERLIRSRGTCSIPVSGTAACQLGQKPDTRSITAIRSGNVIRGVRSAASRVSAQSENNPDGGIGIVEMLFCTSLVALVGAGEKPAFSPRRLQITNTKVRPVGYCRCCVPRQSTICELTFPTSILAVKLNRKRLIVVLEEQIYVYDISNMKLLHTIETSSNPHGAHSFCKCVT